VCTFFCGRDLLPAHRRNVDNVDNARIADSDIKVSRSRIEKNHVRSAAEGHIGKDATRRSVDREQNARIAGAKQTSRYWIKLETMWAFGRHLIFLRYFGRVTSINCHDLGWRSDIDEECIECRVVNRPTGTTGYFDFGNSLVAPNVHYGRGVGIRNGRIADVGNDQKTAIGVECDAIRFDANANLESVPLITRRKH
jgi:hypothetical protein